MITIEQKLCHLTTQKEMMQEFKDATKKDEKSNKKTYVNRINYLKGETV